MKNIYLKFLLLFLLATPALAQEQPTEKKNKDIYTTTSGEWIFSTANIERETTMRFSPFFNLQTMLSFDQSKSFGFFTGLAIRNVGFIFDTSEAVRKKVRTYNIGIPVGFKIGDMEKTFLYGGYELEIPINYKEKTFIDEEKEDKFNVWFSDRTNPIFHTFMVGIQFAGGTNLKFKYYLTEFFNQDFEATDSNGNRYKPYKGLDANIFYFSLCFELFKDSEFYYRK